MINKILDFSLKNRLIIGLLTLAMIAWGIYNFFNLPIDAVPDITNNQVQVITTSPSLAPQEVEQFITFPVEMAMANIQDIVEIRSISRFGLSVVTIVFKDRVDTYLARQLVSEQILIAAKEIPTGYGEPEMMPITTGLGEIYQYVLEVEPGYEGRYDPMELRTIQDWIVKRQLSGIQGIVEISSFGGLVKQYEIAINPRTLVGMDLTILEIFDALEANNQNTGGSYIEKGPNTYYIRAEGLVNSLEDIETIVIKNIEGLPILIKDVAKVGFGSPPRFGAMTRNGLGEAVGGITLMLKGANSADAIKNVKERIEIVQDMLPEGIKIHPYLDRSSLIKETINTVKNNLIEGGLIVIFFLVLLLGSFRSGLIVASVIPLSMLFAFSMMRLFGVTANLMSLGAIDFGLIVDGSVIVVEGIVYRLHTKFNGKTLTTQQMKDCVFTASSQVANSATFGVVIILIVYLPILAFTGIEGKMFKPMAQTVSFALLGALILSVTYVPVISSLFLKKKISNKKNISDRIINFFHKLHQPVLDLALKYKTTFLTIVIIVVAASFWLFTRMGGEFIPTLEEGDLAIQMTLTPGSSLTESIASSSKVEKILLDEFPEVKEVVSKIGTAEVPTDPMAIEDADIMVILKPKSQWTTAKTREELADKMKEALSVLPGLSFEFQQPIQLRFNELMTGVKEDVAVKIYGENLDILFEKASEAASLISKVDGAGDIRVEQIVGLPQMLVKYKRDKIAQYGLSIKDINSIIRSAFAGEAAGQVFEGEKRFDLVVRLDKSYRTDIVNLERLRINRPSEELILLNQVADIKIETGPMQISRDDTKRRITIGINIRNRDVESFIHEVGNILDEHLELLPGYYITYGGQFENLQAAKRSSSIAVPIALALIFILLYFTFKSLKQAVMIFSAIPLATIGGVWALYLRDMPFSISAGVGFIALFGIAVLNGIVLISYYNQLEKEGVKDIYERVRIGTRVRLRPVMLTASTDALGFLPMALSTAAGAEVQKPLATVVIGGLISATFLTLVLLPAIYVIFNDRKKLKMKKSKMKTATILLVIMLGGYSLGAQEISESGEITLEQAIDIAKSNNVLLKNALLDVEASEALKKTSVNLPATNIESNFGQINSSVDDYWIQISQSFHWPGMYVSRKKLITVETDLKRIQYQITENNLIFQVMDAYNEWLFYHEKYEILRKQDSLYTEYARFSELQFEKGDIDYLSKLTALTKSSEIHYQLLETENDIKIAHKKMQQVLYSDIDYIPSEQKMKKFMAFSIPDSVYTDLNPWLRYAFKKTEYQEAEVRLQKKEWFPDFSAGYFNQTIDETVGYDGLYVGLNLPIWFWNQQGNVQHARIKKRWPTMIMSFYNTR